jgi:PleD family two-component response regulator
MTRENDIVFFDLSSLLKIKGMNIQNIAMTNASLLVKEYFDILLKLLDSVPVFLETLEKIADLKAIKNDFKNLPSIKIMLKDAGANDIMLDVESILVAVEKNDMKLAAKHAIKISSDLKELCNKITAAQRARTLDASDSDYTIFENYVMLNDTQPLKKALEHLYSEENTHKPIILVVDDAPVILKTVSAVLGVNNEYKIFTLSNPKMMKKFLEQITPELFLLDYQMPELNGFELVSIIRSFEKHKDTPIIFLTSINTAEIVSAAFKIGACDFMLKPITGDILRQKVRKHIKIKSSP